VAFERAMLAPRDTPMFAYTYDAPGVFAQDDVEIRKWLAVSVSARVDATTTSAPFLSPGRRRFCTAVHGPAAHQLAAASLPRRR